MQELEERIRMDGRIYPGNILKVDSFLNHQVDITLLDHIGAELYRLYQDAGVTKILTIEASGIAIATAAAYHFQVPFVFAKKSRSANIGTDVYTSKVHSYTYGLDYPITLSRRYLDSSDTVLIVDDFLANGKAMDGMLDLCRQAGAKVAGIGICIEKGFQPGGGELRGRGYRVTSLAVIDHMGEDGITFRSQPEQH
jgi:xanthine phosphoribosyltransferase